MGSDREDSPDWMRSFQAPTRSITTLSSGSEASDEKSPSRDDSIEEEETISDIAKTSNAINYSRKNTPKKRVKTGDEIPAKRRKTEKPKKKDSEDDDDDVKMKESFDKPVKTLAQNLWTLSSDSESESNAAIKEEANEESSDHELSKLMTEEDRNDDEGDASEVVILGKSRKKLSKLENDKPTEKKKLNKSVKKEELDATIREKEASDDLATHELSELTKEGKKIDNEETAARVALKRKSPRKQAKAANGETAEKGKGIEPLNTEGEVGAIDAAEEGIPEKHVQSRIGSSTLPLVLPEKVSRSKALVECDGDSIDLSGDMGAVGRVIIPETPSGEPELFLDLKGTIYKTMIVPSRTFCVVSIGPSEAKIEAIMNDFIQLKAQSNVYDAETMVEGTLEGFSFGSEDEADKKTEDVKGDQDEGAEEQTGKKPRGKAEKKSGGTQKKGKATGGKQPKKRKPQATKKGKARK